MKHNFNLVFWMAGWMFTLGLIVTQPITPSLIEQILIVLISFAGWPAFLGLIIGEILFL